MKKIISICSALVFAFTISMVQQVNAQDYQITFAGTGASTTVSSVEVENLSTGTKKTLSGGDILHLTSVVGISQLETNNSSGMWIYPNPMMDNSIIALHPQEAGDAVITVYEITGKTVAKIHTYLNNGRQEFRLSGLKNGMYLVIVTGNKFQCSGKILCNGQAVGNPQIDKVSSTVESRIEKISKKEFSETQGTVDMYYTGSDRLKFKAISGIYSTVKTDIPAEDKTLTFNFIQCTDGDGNNYPIVEIGGQIWMAENLKTIHYNDGSPISLVTNSSAYDTISTPGYSWYDNDSATYNAVYGALYNWYTVNTDKLCPTGWQAPTNEEWTILIDNLGGSEVAGGKLKDAGKTYWANPNGGATNETGFTALPGGFCDRDGSFYGLGLMGRWWSSTESVPLYAWWCILNNSNSNVYRWAGIGPMCDYKCYNLAQKVSVRCLKDDLPHLATQDVTEITTTTAKCGGNIKNFGGYPVTARGVCWSSLHTPTVSDSLTSDGTGAGAFTSSLTGLTGNTRYYIRAYATNSFGTAYGNEIMFATKGEIGSVSDIDGNTYSTIEIGTQTWMAENLRTKQYNDGTSIPLVKDSATWSVLSTPGYCWNNNDSATYDATYGVLYNWYAVNTGKLCPAGWHVPAYAEWTVLTDYLGGKALAGGKLKEAGFAHWMDPNIGATNETGYVALPGGGRHRSGKFNPVGYYGNWWSSTDYDSWDARSLGLNFNSCYADMDWGNFKPSGNSVRCLKDE